LHRYAYTIDVALHEALLRSPHRVADPEAADFFYIPTYLSCAILPVYDFVGPPSYMQGFPPRPVTAMRMLSDVRTSLRSTYRSPYLPIFWCVCVTC